MLRATQVGGSSSRCSSALSSEKPGTLPASERFGANLARRRWSYETIARFGGPVEARASLSRRRAAQHPFSVWHDRRPSGSHALLRRPLLACLATRGGASLRREAPEREQSRWGCHNRRCSSDTTIDHFTSVIFEFLVSPPASRCTKYTPAASGSPLRPVPSQRTTCDPTARIPSSITATSRPATS